MQGLHAHRVPRLLRAGYFHGGLSLFGAVVPVIVFRAGQGETNTAGKPRIDVRYRSDKFTSRVIGLKFHLQATCSDPARVRVEAYDGSGAKARWSAGRRLRARDEKTRGDFAGGQERSCVD